MQAEARPERPVRPPFRSEPRPEPVQHDDILFGEAPAPAPRRDHVARAPRPHDDDAKLVWFTINVGRSKNADPKWLIPLLCRRGGISKNAIGKIQIFQRETRVEISHDVSARFAAAVREPDTKDRNIHIEPVDDFAV
ncbi:MAG TPA: DbpA RNA binding domain-containing protein [Kofleriaceae bacterium]